jgi:uncharacterized membrane protein
MANTFALLSLIAAVICGGLGVWLTYRAIRCNFEPWQRVRYMLFAAGYAICWFGALLLLPFIPVEGRWTVVVFAIVVSPVIAYAYAFRTPRDWREIQQMVKSRTEHSHKDE